MVIKILGLICLSILSTFVLLLVVAFHAENGDRRTIDNEKKPKEKLKADGLEAQAVFIDEIMTGAGQDACDICAVNKRQKNSLICKECEEKING